MVRRPKSSEPLRVGYSTQEASRLLGLPEARIRAFVKAGFLAPQSGPRGGYRFGFQDLVLLRAAKGLREANVSDRRLKAALQALKARMPEQRPLSGVSFEAVGRRLVVRTDDARWDAESGQAVFDFDVGALVRRVRPLARAAADTFAKAERELCVDDWFELGAELEPCAPAQARDAYRRALELDPDYAKAHYRLGRLLEEAGAIGAAEAHYRATLRSEPNHGEAQARIDAITARSR